MVSPLPGPRPSSMLLLKKCIKSESLTETPNLNNNLPDSGIQATARWTAVPQATTLLTDQFKKLKISITLYSSLERQDLLPLVQRSNFHPKRKEIHRNAQPTFVI